MIPRITQGGRSFKGAYAYFGHDKQQTSKDRIAWTHTENILTDDPEKAWKVMAYTAKSHERLKEAAGIKATGRKLEKPVFSFSLAWHPEQDPEKDHILATALKSAEALGLAGHEMLMIGHRDEPQKHVHIIVNRVHPVTGLAVSLSNSKRKLSDFAREYEREHGKIYCGQREENYQKRNKGENTKYHEVAIAKAWAASKDGKSFAQALKEVGCHLAQGDKRIVVVDAYGQIHNPTRHLDGVKAQDIRARVTEAELAALPNANVLRDVIQRQRQQEYEEQVKDFRLKDHWDRVQPKGRGQEPGEDEPSKLKPEFGEQSSKGAGQATRKKEFKELKSELTKPGHEPALPAEKAKLKETEIGKAEGKANGSVAKEESRKSEKPKATPQMHNWLQNKHQEERAEMLDRHAQRLERESDRLSKTYKLEEQKETIRQLAEKTVNPSWWRKLFGMARRDRDHLEALQRGYDNAQMRVGERIAWLENDRKNSLEALNIRQARDKELLMTQGPEALRRHEAKEQKRTWNASQEPGLEW